MKHVFPEINNVFLVNYFLLSNSYCSAAEGGGINIKALFIPKTVLDP